MLNKLIEAACRVSIPKWATDEGLHADYTSLLGKAVLMQFKHENGLRWQTAYPLGIKDDGGGVKEGDFEGLVERYVKLFEKGDFTALRRATLIALICKGDIVSHIGLLQYWFCPVSKGGFIHKYATYLDECTSKGDDEREALVKASFDGITRNGWPVCAPGQWGNIGSADSSFSKLEWRGSMPYSLEECELFSKAIRKERTVEKVLFRFHTGICQKSGSKPATKSWWSTEASRTDKLWQRKFMAPQTEKFTDISFQLASDIVAPQEEKVEEDSRTITVSGHEEAPSGENDYTVKAGELILLRHQSIISNNSSNINI